MVMLDTLMPTEDELRAVSRGAAVRGITDCFGFTTYMRVGEGVNFVYFFQRGDLAIKIGTTTHLNARKTTIEAYAGPLKTVGLLLGNRSLENDLHKRFHDHRLHHEWFRAAPPLMDFLKTIQPASRKIVEAINA